MKGWSPNLPADPTPGAISAISSIKEIVTVVMALTMTNTLVLLLTGGHYSSVSRLEDLSPQETIFSGLLILTIFRFYHGNIRHLDSVYGCEERSSHTVKPAPLGGLGVDFFVILAQSILFAVMSFYANSPKQLLVLFIILLASDVTWVLVVQKPSEDRHEFSHLRRWMLNNVLALIAILAVYAIAGNSRGTNFLVIAGAIVMLCNALFDFTINWHFYFPGNRERPEEPQTHIFVAGPLTQMMHPDTGLVSADYRAWLEGVISALEHAGHGIISAHVREQWGERLDSPATALKTDLEGLMRSDAIVADVGSPPSPGVQFELGVATSLGIPVVLILEKGQLPPYLNPALPAVVSTDIIELNRDSKSYQRIVDAVADILPA